MSANSLVFFERFLLCNWVDLSEQFDRFTTTQPSDTADETLNDFFFSPEEEKVCYLYNFFFHDQRSMYLINNNNKIRRPSEAASFVETSRSRKTERTRETSL